MISPRPQRGRGAGGEGQAPSPPWQLHGSAVLLVRDWRSCWGLVHYTDSPVGPYEELSVATLSLRGPIVTAMWVTSLASLVGGRENWGYPKELANLRWLQHGRWINFQADAACWRLRAWGPSVPLRAGLWTVQKLHGQRVRVPLRVQGRLRIVWRGRQMGVLVESFKMTVFAPEKL